MNEEVMSVKDWLITLLVFCIPCVGIIMMFVWAFSDGNENRKNYCRAALIMVAVITAFSTILMLISGAALFSMLGGMYY